MQERNNEDLYNPIDLNHIFNDDDILDEWIREGEEPILSSDSLDWLDKGFPLMKKVDKQFMKMMVLILNNLRNHIFLIMDYQANHLSQHI